MQLDPHLVADVVQGELRADNLASIVLKSQVNSSSDTNTTSTSPTYNDNYAVSPKELSLRLHQLIQTRLEERIEELERELLQSQRQLQVMEAERVSSQRTFSNSDMGFSWNQESPRGTKPSSAAIHPFCLNLSGDALCAYDEAYEEFMQVAGKEDTPLSPTNKGEWINGCKSDSSCRSLPWENMLWSSRGSDETMKYEEEEQDGESGNVTDEEEGRMLIRQLVERTKQSSSALMNAQKMLLLMGE